jgi:hypothetical protein
MQGDKQVTATATKPEAPKARRYKFRANANCGKRGDSNAHPAFDGVALRYEGDEFFMTLPPAVVKLRDKDGKVVKDDMGRPKRVVVDRTLPTWADPIAEYPLEVPEKPLRVIAGSAPTTQHSLS